MLPVTERTLRVFVHVAAATVWYGVLIVTGVVNLLAVNLSNRSSEYIATLAVKLVAVALSGIFAAAHAIYGGRRVARATAPEVVRRRRAISGILGAGSALSAAAALFLGVLLA